MGPRDHFRDELALSQQQRATRAQVSKTTIVNIEAGCIRPHPLTVRKLAAGHRLYAKDRFGIAVRRTGGMQLSSRHRPVRVATSGESWRLKEARAQANTRLSTPSTRATTAPPAKEDPATA